MKNKRGMTLVEIIIAIAMLGIISMLLFPALTNQYIMLRGTRSMTADLFSAQQEIELVISDIKKDVQAGIPPDGQTKTSYTLFTGQPSERVVDGYANNISVHVDNNNITLNTIVADNRMPLFDVAVASNVRLRFYNGASYLTNAYTDTPSLSVVSSYDLYDPANVNLTNINRWYVSREGFNSPMVTSPTEIENGTTYPRYPEDYTLIHNVTGSNLTTISTQYAGRHLIYTVTPASQSGKMGTTVPSNPVFISGLPVIGNLILHLDASMLSRESSTVRTAADDRLYVQQWNDISGRNNHAVQNTEARQPELLDTKTGHVVVGAMTYETYAKYLRFSGSQGISVPDPGTSSLDVNNLTVFAVYRSTSLVSPKTIVSKTSSTTGWHMGWTASNQLGLTIRNSGGINTVSGDLDAGLDGDWHILTGTSALTFQIDSATPAELTRTVSQAITNNNALTIGFDGGSNYSTIDVAEIIIYNGVLSTDDQYKINMYLTNKYTPASPDVYIYALKPITDSAVIGEPYILPGTVRAYMTNGTMMDVAVTWSENPIDTSTAGLKTSVATAISNPSKTTTAKIDVAGIASLVDQQVTVMQNDPYTLPTSAVAILTTGKQRSTPVTWDNNTIDTSVLGDHVRTGTSTIDPGKTMMLTVTVVPKSVSGVSLNASDQTINVGETFQLVATVSPSDAFNKNVSWSSADPGIASVDPVTGLVTAVSGGNTTITATTQDGGFTASCNFIVTTSATGVTLDITSIVATRNSVFNLTATVLPETASNKNVTWSSSNTSIATVNQNGRVTVTARTNQYGQSATITVTTEVGGHTATCLVTAGYPVTGVSLSPASLTLNQGSSYNLTANFSPSNATVKTGTWSSSNPGVATVDNNGRVTGVSVGSATITFTSEDGGHTAQSNVQVVNPVTGVTLNVSTLSLPRGESYTLIPQVLPIDATNQNVTWSSSNSTYVSVNSAGVITATTNSSYVGRSATITVRTVDGGYTATCVVTVGSPVTGVSLSPSSITVQQGSYSDLTAVVSPADAANPAVTWSSSNTSVATVNSNGRVTAVGGGTTVITVTTVDGGFTAQCTVTVPLYATGISGGSSSFTVTFNKPMQSATPLSSTYVNVSGNTVTVTRNTGDFSGGSYNLTVGATDGTSKTITVRLVISGWWFWTTYTWYLDSP